MIAAGAGVALVPIRRGAPRFVVSIAAPAARRSSPAARAFVAMAQRHAIDGGARL
jgi:hypothetical protein